MESLSFEAAQHSYILAHILSERAGLGLDIVLGPTDMELAALGLFVMVLLSEHPPSAFEGLDGRD